MAMEIMRYRLKQEERGQIWTSPVFEAETVAQIIQAVRAGWLTGVTRWAEDEEGELIYGLSVRGIELV